jgi:hypothetical protein
VVHIDRRAFDGESFSSERSASYERRAGKWQELAEISLRSAASVPDAASP